MTLFQLDLIVYTDTHTHILHPNRFYYFIIHNENGKSFSKCIEYGWQIIHCSSPINLLQYEIYFLLVLTAWVAHQFVYPFKCFECETEIFSFDSSFYSLFLFLFFCWKWRKTFRNVYFITVLKSYLFHSYIPIYMSTINCYIIPFFFFTFKLLQRELLNKRDLQIHTQHHISIECQLYSVDLNFDLRKNKRVSIYFKRYMTRIEKSANT